MAHVGRVLRVLAAYLGASDARPRQLIAGYGRHLMELAQLRQVEARIGDDDYLGITMRGLVPARIGTALLFLDADTAERSVDELAAFLDLAKSISEARITEASDAEELTDALLASLDTLHAFLMGNELVGAAYADATSADWLEQALNALHPRPSDADAYDVILNREPTHGATDQRDLALAA